MSATRPIMWMFTIQLYWCMNVLQWFVDGSTTQSLEYISSGIYGYVPTGKGVLQTMNVSSGLHCADICAEDPLCSGFFHHQGDGVCVTSKGYFLKTSGLSIYTGMSYYKAKTCAEWAARGLNTSTRVHIDPIGSGSALSVQCDFDKIPGQAITVLNHNWEARTFVSGYEKSGSYRIPLVYNVGIELAGTVADLSAECKQYLRWECYNAALTGNVYWITRIGSKATYFNGSPPPGKRCACGDSYTCAIDKECNCDMNDFVERNDTGYVTDKTALPISGFEAADTGTVV